MRNNAHTSFAPDPSVAPGIRGCSRSIGELGVTGVSCMLLWPWTVVKWFMVAGLVLACSARWGTCLCRRSPSDISRAMAHGLPAGAMAGRCPHIFFNTLYYGWPAVAMDLLLLQGRGARLGLAATREGGPPARRARPAGGGGGRMEGGVTERRQRPWITGAGIGNGSSGFNVVDPQFFIFKK